MKRLELFTEQLHLFKMKIYHLIISSLVLSLCNAKRLILDQLDTMKIVNCKGNIIRRLYNCHTNILYVRHEKDDFNVQVGDLAFITVSTNNFNYHHSFNKYYDFVIPARNSSELFDTLNDLWAKKIWNTKLFPRRKYLIFMESRENVDEVFRYLKKMFIIKIILIVFDDAANYQIYRTDNICKEPTYKIEKGSCNDIKETKFLKRRDTNLRGCPLKVIALPWYTSDNYAAYEPGRKIGITIRPMFLLRQKFGANVSFTVPNRSEQLIIGSPEGEISTIDGDVVACSLFRGLFNSFKYFELTNSIMREKILWFVSKPEQYNNLETVLNVFHYKFLLVYVIVYLLEIVIDRIYISVHQLKKTDLSTSMLQIFLLGLGCCIHKMPKSTVKRIFLISYIYFSFFVCLTFHTRLSSVLTVPMYEKPINSLEELLQSSYTIFLSTRAKLYYENLTNPLAKMVMKRATFYTKNNDTMSDVQMVLNNPKSAAISRKLKCSFAEYRSAHKFPDEIISIIDISYVLPNGSYFMYYLDDIVRLVQEHGFLGKWTNEVMYEHTPKESDKLKSLHMSQFQAAFTAWTFGIVISAIVFVAEIIWHKLKK